MTHHRRHGNNDTGTYDAEMTTALSPAQRYAAFKQTQAKRQSVSSRFARSMPFELDDFQVKANDALEAGDNVLVAAPTGAGKTVVADFAIYLAQERNVKAFYTTPIKALSNQKYPGRNVRAGQSRPAYRRHVHQLRSRHRGHDHRGPAQHALRAFHDA
jgi:ATP-dependent RNA helicase HelY